MTKVVHITSVHNPLDARIFHRELKSLQVNGYETSLIAHTEESRIREGIQILSAGKPNSRVQRWYNLPSLFKTAWGEKADIYHFHDPELLPIGLLLQYMTDAKIVYDVHEDYSDAISVREWIPDGIKPILSSVFTKIQGELIKYFDLIITADSSTQRKLQEQTDTPVLRVRNLPIIEGVEFDTVEVERSHDYILAYVGGLDRERGIMEMLQVTAQLKAEGVDVGLWLLGPFQDEKIKAEAEKYIDDRGIEKNVRLYGYVEHKNIFSYLQKADIGLLLADKQRFEKNVPTKFFEYMYAGLPIVSTEIPSLTNYRSDEYCITVPEDINYISSTISQLLPELKKREKMGTAARNRILTEYSWEIEQKELLRAYRKLTP